MPAQLYVPGRSEKRKRIWVCNYCGTKFRYGEKSIWKNHVLACDKRNAEQLEEHAHARANNAFTGILDKEQYAFERKKASK